jgi:hypothetical protein
MRAIPVALAMLVLFVSCAKSQQPSQKPTANMSIKITTGGTFQQVAPLKQSMQSLTIQNNNPMAGAEMCYLDVSGAIPLGALLGGTANGVGSPAPATWQGATILLPPGASYTRYYPYIPQGPIVATCTTTNDTLYVDWQ